MTTVFVLFSARTASRCVLNVGTFVGLQRALLLGKMASLFLKKKHFSINERKKREDMFWSETSSDAKI
jgi:hypothetical protein